MKDIMIYVVWIAVLSLTTVLGNAQTVVIKDLNTATVENRSLYLSVNAEKELSKEGNAYANRDKKPKDLPKNRFTYYPFYYNFYFQSSGMERLDFKARNLNCKLDYKYAVYEKDKKGRLKKSWVKCRNVYWGITIEYKINGIKKSQEVFFHNTAREYSKLNYRSYSINGVWNKDYYYTIESIPGDFINFSIKREVNGFKLLMDYQTLLSFPPDATFEKIYFHVGTGAAVEVDGFSLTEKTVYAKSLSKREEAFKAMDNENYQYARTLLKQMVKDGNTDEDVVFALAVANSELGSYSEAIDGFTSVINYNRSPLAYALRGLCKYASGKDGWESDLRLGGSDGVDLLRKINEEAANKQQKNSSPPQRSYLQNSGSKSLRDYL